MKVGASRTPLFLANGADVGRNADRGYLRPGPVGRVRARHRCPGGLLPLRAEAKLGGHLLEGDADILDESVHEEGTHRVEITGVGVQPGRGLDRAEEGDALERVEGDVVDALHRVEDGRQGDAGGGDGQEGGHPYGELGLEAAEVEEGRLDRGVVGGLGAMKADGEEVLDELERRRSVDSPVQGLEDVDLHGGDLGGGVAAPAEVGQKLGLHLERFVELDGHHQGRHGGELVLLPVGARRPRPADARRNEAVEVGHTDPDRLAGKLTKIYHLRAPFGHLGSAVGVDRFGLVLGTASTCTSSAVPLLSSLRLLMPRLL